jgi:hypothetical protein
VISKVAEEFVAKETEVFVDSFVVSYQLEELFAGSSEGILFKIIKYQSVAYKPMSF